MSSDSHSHRSEPERVLILTNIPNHYRVPLFNEIRRQLIHVNSELSVVFATESYEARRSRSRSTTLDEAEFDYHILSSWVIGANNPLFIPRGLSQLMNSIQPSVIIVGGIGVLAAAAGWNARRRSVPLVIWTGELPREGSLLTAARAIPKRVLLRMAEAVVAYGTLAGKFAIELAPETAIYYGWNTTDLEPFLQIRRELHSGVTRPFQITTVGDLVEIKGHRELLCAIAALDGPIRDAIRLKIVGGGPREQLLWETATELGIEKQLVITGSVPAESIPPILSQCDLFVFPSKKDVWGLALVEALAAGLPVVASSRAGATADLVSPASGFAVDPTDVATLRDAINQAVSMAPEERAVLGRNGRERVMQLCDISNSAAAFVDASMAVMQSAAH